MPKGRLSRIPSVLLLIFSLFIVYGTILPFNIRGIGNFHHRIEEINWKPFLAQDNSRTSISDVIQNVLLFIPIGFFGWLSTRRFKLKFDNRVIILFYGAILSFSVEFLQLFTTDRTTSVTDLITNSAGTLLGIYLAVTIRKSWKNISHRQIIISVINYPHFTSFVFLSCIICAYLLQPFDFALDFSVFKLKLQHFFLHPFHFSFTGKYEPFIILLFSTLTFLLFSLVRHLKSDISALIVLSGTVCFGVFLESLQLIIKSRVPQLSDLIVEATGIFAGFLFYKIYPLFFPKPQTVFKSAFLIAFLCNQFYPYKISFSFQKIRWIPLFSGNSGSTMTNLGNTIETCIIFSFAGYISHRLCSNLSRKTSFLMLVLAVIIVLEFLQGWITGRNPDLTDILVAFLVFVFGRFVSENEKTIFTDTNKLISSQE